jgi:ribonuclease VapC
MSRSVITFDILAPDDQPMVSAVTLYETVLVAGIRRGPDNVEDLTELLQAAEARVMPFDEARARAALAAYLRYGKGIHAAARLKRPGRMALARTPNSAFW